MSLFKCVHCDLPFRTLCETVDYNIITHPTEELRVKRYRRRGSYNGWQTTNFPGVFPQGFRGGPIFPGGGGSKCLFSIDTHLT